MKQVLVALNASRNGTNKRAITCSAIRRTLRQWRGAQLRRNTPTNKLHHWEAGEIPIARERTTIRGRKITQFQGKLSVRDFPDRREVRMHSQQIFYDNRFAALL